ncbi:hypothetical protein W911_06835 [Hyphomicrobium nitrativorans NL23]|uniref:Uncharacterized protein n=1 Tax=Hyphomicrobium nitrativorans NL23 TaxID=1029756 RepID=V5SIZ7_9HYPH|nr:hypothetical protein W911_06835 [Hyphomicrobium nitrativorans NL23]
MQVFGDLCELCDGRRVLLLVELGKFDYVDRFPSKLDRGLKPVPACNEKRPPSRRLSRS